MSFKLKLAAVFAAVFMAGSASSATCSFNAVNFSLEGSSNSQCGRGTDIGKNGIVAQNKEMFGMSGWILGQTTSKRADAVRLSDAGYGAVTFSAAPGFKQTSGNWALEGSGFGALMIVLKAGGKMSAFLINDLEELAGLWSTERDVCTENGCKKVGFRLKHASVYYIPQPDPSPVPVPAAGFLLLAGLAGLAGLRRARKSA